VTDVGKALDLRRICFHLQLDGESGGVGENQVSFDCPQVPKGTKDSNTEMGRTRTRYPHHQSRSSQLGHQMRPLHTCNLIPSIRWPSVCLAISLALDMTHLPSTITPSSQSVMVSVVTHPGGERAEGEVRHLVVAGYTGRDTSQVQAHIDELAREGISPPPQIPMFYSVPVDRLVVGERARVDGEMTSGEVEPVLLYLAGRRFVGVGSDHTDRHLERSDIALSKAACPKMIAPVVLDYDFALGHWDELQLRSWVGQERRPYQSGAAGRLRSPDELTALLEGGLSDGTVLFMGTIPLLEPGFVYADRFEFEMSAGDDNSTIGGSYELERRAK